MYWFPSSAAEAKGSSLLTSRTLSVLSARCLSLALVTPDNTSVRSKYGIPEVGSGVVSWTENAAEIGRVATRRETDRRQAPSRSSWMTELDKREDAAKSTLQAANEKIKQKDIDAAAAMLTQIWEQHCLVPDVAKKAAKALKKIGRPVDVGELDSGTDACRIFPPERPRRSWRP